MSDENSTISQTKLFVGGLNWKIRWKELRDEFSKFGEVVFARVKLDEENNKSKWFWFVEFIHPEDAAQAQKQMNGQEIMGRAVNVDFAKENPDRIQAMPEVQAEVIEL